jgi:hypothetical protein
MPAGTLAGYENLEFKIKSTETTVKVKVPEEEREFTIADGTPLDGGWTQMSIPMSTFGTAPDAATEFAIWGPGGTTLYLTDIVLSGEGEPPPVWDDITVAAPAPGDLTDAIVLYSDAKASDANITSYLADWSENIAHEEVVIDTNNTLRYLATTSGSGALGSGVAGIELSALDVSAQINIHIDFHAVGDVELVKIKFVSPEDGNPAGYASMLDNVFPTNGTWYSIDVPLDTIPIAAGGAGEVDWSRLIQIVIITYGPASTIDEPTGYYIDNVYFYGG